MFKRIDHVGVIVDDLEEAKGVLEEFGMSFKREFIAGERLKGAFYTCGETDLELIEIMEPAERAVRLGDGQARIEHIGIEVEKLAPAVEALRALGVAFTSDDPLVVGNTVNLWTSAETCDGVAYQLTEYTD